MDAEVLLKYGSSCVGTKRNQQPSLFLFTIELYTQNSFIPKIDYSNQETRFLLL